MRSKKVLVLVVLTMTCVSVYAQAPQITAVDIDIAPDSAVITVSTDVATTAVIDYGLDTSYGSQAPGTGSSDTHVVTLGPLAEATLYHFRITVTDGIDQTVGGDSTFTTESYPVISALQVDAVTEHTVTISFTTDTPTLADFKLQPVDSPPETILFDNDGVYKTSHVVTLDTLYFEEAPNNRLYRPAAGLEYEFLVWVTDAQGNQSADTGGFTTPDYPSDPIPDWQLADVGAPLLPGHLRYDATDSTAVIFGSGTSLFNRRDVATFLYQPVSGNFEVSGRVNMYAGVMASHTKGGALFRGDVPTDPLGALHRGATIVAQSINYSSEEVLYYRPAVEAQHVEVERTDLQQADGDSIWVRLRREGNDFTVTYSNDGVSWQVHGPALLNLALPLDGLAGVVGLSHFGSFLSEITYRDLSLATWADTLAPALSNVDATPVNNTADVVWDANEWVTAVLEFGTTSSYGDSVVVDTLHVDHLVHLSGLTFDTEYHYRIRAYDSDSNEVVTPDMSFVTEPDNPLAVQLVAFGGRVVSDREVLLEWSMLSADGIASIDVEQKAGSVFVASETVAVTGEETEYSVRLTDVPYGQQVFRLRFVEVDGAVTYSNEIDLLVELLGGFALTDAYPNPFRHSASFSLTVTKPQHVTVEVFNLSGQRVAVLYDGTLAAQVHQEFVFDGSSLADGVYFYRVRGGDFVASNKFVLVK